MSNEFLHSFTVVERDDGEGFKLRSTRPTRLYLAGPMRGYDDFNFPAFRQAASRLRAVGFEVYSPAERDEEDPEAVAEHERRRESGDFSEALPFAYYMQFDLALVCKADHVVVLDGWEDSTGAVLEAFTAVQVGHGVYRYKTLERISDEYVFAAMLRKNADTYEGVRLSVDLPAPPATPEATLKATNPKDAIGSDKLPLHLWPETASLYGCLGMLDGMLKYGRSNWRAAGVRFSIYLDALRRHMAALDAGEWFDPDSGVPHLSHMLACCAIIADAHTYGMLLDDRQYGDSAQYRALVDEFTPHVARLKDKHAERHPKHYTYLDNNDDLGRSA